MKEFLIVEAKVRFAFSKCDLHFRICFLAKISTYITTFFCRGQQSYSAATEPSAPIYVKSFQVSDKCFWSIL